MARGRSWRRWRGEVKLARVYFHKAHWARNADQWYRRNSFSYERITGIGERITVTVSGDAQYQQYAWFKAKILRDNPKVCNCSNCCNPRRSGVGNTTKLVLHISEMRALESSKNQMANEESISTSKWRARKVHSIRYEHHKDDRYRYRPEED